MNSVKLRITAGLTGLLPILLASCVGMSPGGRQVEIVQPQQAMTMTFVGNVATSSPLAGLAMRNVSYENALNKALNQAAAMGADALVLDPESGPRFWGINQTVRGKAYRYAR